MSHLPVLLANYDDDHRNATSRAIHLVCMPLILGSIIAMVWTLPVPGTWFQPGAFAGALMAALAAWIFRGSRALGLGAALAFVVTGTLCWGIAAAIGMRGLLLLAIVVFVLAWIGKFIGQRFEGKHPGFLDSLVGLLIGPIWVLAKLYRRLDIAY